MSQTIEILVYICIGFFAGIKRKEISAWLKTQLKPKKKSINPNESKDSTTTEIKKE